MTNYKLRITNYELNNYPNPFNPTTEIRYQFSDISEIDNVSIEIFNIKGRKIKTLSFDSAQDDSVVWDGTDKHRNQVSSGVYLYRLTADNKVLMSNKMIMIK
jgi:flagellar hook assembly protein FlgD